MTGSAHCSLAPYWSSRLGKEELVARQESRRGGTLYCSMTEGDKVAVEGDAVTFLKGHINVEEEE